MTKEAPYSNEYIQDMLARNLATKLYPESLPDDEPVDQSKDWIYDVIAELKLAHFEQRFLESLSAGHTVADSAREAGKPPQWGLDFLQRLSKLCDYRG